MTWGTYSDEMMAASVQRLRDRYAKALATPTEGGKMARPPAPTEIEAWSRFCRWRMGLGPRPDGLDPRWDTFDPPKPDEGTLYLPPSRAVEPIDALPDCLAQDAPQGDQEPPDDREDYGTPWDDPEAFGVD